MSSIVNTLFHGEESLSSSNSRVAWNLLIPTVALLLVVAVRPLEETFVTSVTNKRFASGDQKVEFVGLDNYKNLLTVRMDIVDCKKDEAGNCEVNERTGKTMWELINRDLLEKGYRTADVYSIGNGRGVAFSGTDEGFILATFNTLRFTLSSVVLELLLGIIIALVVNSSFKGRGVMRAAMLVPWAIPTVVSAKLWDTMLRDNTSGIINKFALDVGLVDQSKAWLTEAGLQMNAIIAVDVWKTAPFMALLVLAGLQTLPSDIYEAAQVDGASRIRQFFSITLPLLRPTIAVALVFRTLDALRVFDVFQVLLGRQRLSMATYNYEQLISNRDAGYASAIGVVIFVVIFIFTAIYMRILGIESEQ
ncbi:MAG: sugar ABC transporter permease [Chloroflexi bacterium]|nr:sugar ABC transporter permease [Chloroflexota bacterium]